MPLKLLRRSKKSSPEIQNDFVLDRACMGRYHPPHEQAFPRCSRSHHPTFGRRQFDAISEPDRRRFDQHGDEAAD
jgi:hypothetical protein